MNDKFAEGRARLLNKEPFFAAFMYQCSFEINNEVETISVYENEGTIFIVYSEEWVEKTSVKHIEIAIKHVLLHVIFGHLHTEQFESNQKMEIAKDLAVNTNLNKDELPEEYIHPKDLGLPSNLSTYEYYRLLPDAPKGQKGKSEDNHKYMKADSNESVVQNNVSNMLKQANNKAGKLPSSFGDGARKIVALILRPPEISWKTLLKQFIAFASKVLKKKTWKRANKRYGSNMKGIKKEQRLNIFVALDESGSIQDEEWNKFMNEIEGIYKTKEVGITLCRFTTKVEEQIEYKGIEKIKSSRFIGGTLFQPVFDAAEEENPDALIILTDGYNFDYPCRYSQPNTVLWVLTSDGELKENFGKSIKLKKAKKSKAIVW